jgi:hypothetical protein
VINLKFALVNEFLPIGDSFIQALNSALGFIG